MTTSRRVRVTERGLAQAAAAGLLRPEQAAPLWIYLLAQSQATPEDRPRFSLTHVLYYLGGMLAIGAMSLFMTLGGSSFGGWGVLFIALQYGGVAWKLALRFEAQRLPIQAAVDVAMVAVDRPGQ
jgi:predicted lipid-binding transport protein (Tim44 family)